MNLRKLNILISLLNFAIKNNWATELSSSRLVKNAKQIQCRITNMHKIELYYEWVQIANWISFQSNVINFRCKNLHILISTTLFIHFLNIVTNDLLCSYVHKIRLNKNFIMLVVFLFILEALWKSNILAFQTNQKSLFV